MSDTVGEKKLRTLPAVRVEEELYELVAAEVMRLSDASVAVVMRRALRTYFELHGRIVSHDEGDDK